MLSVVAPNSSCLEHENSSNSKSVESSPINYPHSGRETKRWRPPSPKYSCSNRFLETVAGGNRVCPATDQTIRRRDAPRSCLRTGLSAFEHACDAPDRSRTGSRPESATTLARRGEEIFSRIAPRKHPRHQRSSLRRDLSACSRPRRRSDRYVNARKYRPETSRPGQHCRKSGAVFALSSVSAASER